MSPFTGAVLTGGASTRMGTDKAQLVVDGRALASIAAAALADAGAAEVLAIGGDLDALRALGLDARPDEHPGEGPLGGIITALGAATHDVTVVLACDMPAIDRDAVAALVAALDAESAADVAAALDGDRLQVLTAAYRGRVRPVLEARFGEGERAVRRAIESLVVVTVDDLEPRTLADVDGPADLRRYAQPS
jgi:molybdenum cofactor guanylyltransferase